MKREEKYLKHVYSSTGDMSLSISMASLDRGIGRSLSQALSFIGKALASPCVNVYVVDHHGTYRSNKYLLDQVKLIIFKLGLVGIECNERENYIEYKPFGLVEVTYKYEIVE